MGYTTDFEGALKLEPKATEEQIEYINRFSASRRMKRDVGILIHLYKGEFGLNFVVGKVYGKEGEYFAPPLKKEFVIMGDKDESVINYNVPPSTQPGLWCQWVLTEDGTELMWDESEKFYYYVEWLQYMIDNFFDHWGIKLNGEIEWIGEDSDDRGKICVINSKITVLKGRVIYQ